MPVEPVPDADRQEQDEPASPDPHRTHHLDPDRPEADVLEQEMPTEVDAAIDVDERPPRPTKAKTGSTAEASRACARPFARRAQG